MVYSIKAEVQVGEFTIGNFDSGEFYTLVEAIEAYDNLRFENSLADARIVDASGGAGMCADKLADMHNAAVSSGVLKLRSQLRAIMDGKSGGTVASSLFQEILEYADETRRNKRRDKRAA